MIPNNNQREELHRAIWSIADDLRGAVDGWDFKNYVLGTMFYRFISEDLANYVTKDERAAGDSNFNYENIADEEAEQAREDLVNVKGYFILPSELFVNVCKRAETDENLNQTLSKIFKNIEESSKGTPSEFAFEGLFDDFDVNNKKLGSTVKQRNEKLAQLLIGVQKMGLGTITDHDIDAFGDAYEYLMSMYASSAGKSGGEFFSPASVSVLLTKLGTVGKKRINAVYDPACGSGSLLLKSADILGKDGVRLGFYGQEINVTTYNLCRINMLLHNVGFDRMHFYCGNTLLDPMSWAVNNNDLTFDLVVSNPPYSIKWVGDDDTTLINDQRFSPAGVLAPKSKADMAFIMHILSMLSPEGTGCIVCFPGVMYRGGKEKKIRQYLVEQGVVDCIIQLPQNLFYGTSIGTCIMILKKDKKDSNILFIDASNEYVKATNNNILSDKNIDKIVETFAKREEVEHFAHLATLKEIQENDYNLSVSAYVEPENKVEKVDIQALNKQIDDLVAHEQVMRNEINKNIAEIEEWSSAKENAYE